mmetsp:Transcript_102052/g.327501  ORF Transcript_102052/g.327501 Transcript_102052/m.327501 type:complete len:165 (+) Transcript_102052:1349-1843(+)
MMNPEGWTAQSVLSRVRNGDVATREVGRSVANRAGRSLIELINEALACEGLLAQLDLTSARRCGELLKKVGDNTKEEQHEPITEMDWHTEELNHDRKQETMQIVGQLAWRRVGLLRSRVGAARRGRRVFSGSARDRDEPQGYRPGDRGHSPTRERRSESARRST